jgi:hypothetical protein
MEMETGEQPLWSAMSKHLEITERLLGHCITQHPTHALRELQDSVSELRQQIERQLR